MCWATAWVTPCCCRPLVRVLGRVLTRPAIKSEKNTAIEIAVPEFWKVARIPEATPRYRAGTLLIIDDVLGAANMPLPIPLAAISRAKAQ